MKEISERSASVGRQSTDVHDRAWGRGRERGREGEIFRCRKCIPRWVVKGPSSAGGWTRSMEAAFVPFSWFIWLTCSNFLVGDPIRYHAWHRLHISSGPLTPSFCADGRGMESISVFSAGLHIRVLFRVLVPISLRLVFFSLRFQTRPYMSKHANAPTRSHVHRSTQPPTRSHQLAAPNQNNAARFKSCPVTSRQSIRHCMVHTALHDIA